MVAAVPRIVLLLFPSAHTPLVAVFGLGLGPDSKILRQGVLQIQLYKDLPQHELGTIGEVLLLMIIVCTPKALGWRRVLLAS